ncbi:MAG: hypothetical protein JXQ30_11115 [Spirochaetes bacterium]|nr:hypothetical protein [Spirochaetota bacterium]
MMSSARDAFGVVKEKKPALRWLGANVLRYTAKGGFTTDASDVSTG